MTLSELELVVVVVVVVVFGVVLVFVSGDSVLVEDATATAGDDAGSSSFIQLKLLSDMGRSSDGVVVPSLAELAGNTSTERPQTHTTQYDATT